MVTLSQNVPQAAGSLVANAWRFIALLPQESLPLSEPDDPGDSAGDCALAWPSSLPHLTVSLPCGFLLGPLPDTYFPPESWPQGLSLGKPTEDISV